MCCLVSPRALTVALLQTARAELVRRYLDQTPTGAIRWATLRGRNHPIAWSIRPTRRCNRDIRSPPYAFQAKCVSGVKRFCVHVALQLTKSRRSVGNDSVVCVVWWLLSYSRRRPERSSITFAFTVPTRDSPTRQ